jgi:cytosolic iron-sulfur protein assembly protein CIAO1
MTSEGPPPAPPTLTPLATLSSPTITRAWQSTPHPHTSLLATATADKSVAVWSLRDFRLLSTITGGHKRSIRSVAWKDTGKNRSGGIVLATGSFDSNTGIWTRNERQVERRNNGGVGAKDEEDLFGGAEDADALDGSAGAEEEEEWAFSSLLTGPDSEIKSVAFSPTNPALLATSSRDKSVWVWEDVADTAGGGGGDDSEYETVAVLAEHTGDVKCVAWHPEREVLASASYDDTVRLWRDIEEEGDWCCVGVLEGHGGTVWGVAWEGLKGEGQDGEADGDEDGGLAVKEPRLASCSDDLSVRIWKKVSKDREREGTGSRLPSIIRPPSSMETWVQEAMLPQMHVRSVYAVAWSSISGLLVTCGGDGGIYVYKERSVQHTQEVHTNGEVKEVVMNGIEDASSSAKAETEWVVVAQIEAAHAEYEINHVCWARRQDRDKRQDDEEVIVSSGDDGAVRVWALPAI